jgi:hypothetical protein
MHLSDCESEPDYERENEEEEEELNEVSSNI